MYSFIDLSTVPGGRPLTFGRSATGINNQGQVVGRDAILNVGPPGTPQPAANASYGFVISGGQVTPLTPSSFGGSDVSINNSGAILAALDSSGTGTSLVQGGVSRPPTGISHD